MEPLGATASVIAIAELLSKVAKYVNSAVGASKERKSLRLELRACQNILQELVDEADNSEEGRAWSETIKALEAPGAPLSQLRVALDTIEVKLKPKEGVSKVLARLEWPFNEKEIKGIHLSIEREKSLLELALANNSRKLIQEIKRTSDENKKHLINLIQLTKESSEERERQFSQLRDGMLESHSNLHDGLNGLRRCENDRMTLEKRMAIIDWLTPIDYASEQSDFISRRESGTGQWFLDSPEFKTWIETKNQTLFCPGIPGTGKTILTSVVVEELMHRVENDRSIGIAYLYCNFRRQHEQKSEDILASLLKQLSQSQLSLPNSVISLYDRHLTDRLRPTYNEIITTLQSVATLYPRLFIVIDALDEYQVAAPTQKTFLPEIFDLQAKCGLNLYATSRFIPKITESFDKSIVLEIKASEHDVGKYVDNHLSCLPSFVRRNEALQQEVRAKIINAVDGMYVTIQGLISKALAPNNPRFLLAKLHLESLAGKISPRAVRVALSQLPTGSKAYDHAYTDAMTRIHGQVHDQEQLATKVLSWITRAKERLTTLELRHALAVEIYDGWELDEECLPEVEDMVSVCAGLVTVDQRGSIIRLVHFTTQEYFARTWEKWFPDSETKITKICTTYLSFDTFRRGRCNTNNELTERLQLNPFYLYAARNWMFHAQRAHATVQEAGHFLRSSAHVEASVQVLSKHANAAMGILSGAVTDITGLHLTAFFGLDNVTLLLLDTGDVDPTDSDGRTPLSYAAQKGHVEVIRMLIRQQADPNSTDAFGQTPLLYAVENGHLGALKVFLDSSKFHVYLEDYNCQRALEKAIRYGREGVVELLLATEKVDVDRVDRVWGTPLSMAARFDLEGIARLLLATEKVHADQVDKAGRTPLSLAARYGSEAVVRVLLNTNKVNVDSKAVGLRGRTPLSFAAQRGHEAVVRLLLDTGQVDVNSRASGRTPLSFAAERGHEAVVRLLLENGQVDADAEAAVGTPLFFAVQGGHETVVRLLLDTGRVDVDSVVFLNSWVEDPYRGWTPLLLAAQTGEEAIMRLLLENAADPNWKDETGRTPLFWAAWYGREAACELLLSTPGVDLDVKVVTHGLHQGQTPLSCAVSRGHKGIVQLLLEKGAKLRFSGSAGL
ncbi:hypothetical protein AK830_g8693 [Neonectria ditissima]|uniref:Uncharacterized protein n=1 Tax=Neonectria ditissima TaxID=78410 RepID=A0A0P7AWP8_9HYPO|nr:hypothetical protein AK830_g8693 [Neonectria ditissima]